MQDILAREACCHKEEERQDKTRAVTAGECTCARSSDRDTLQTETRMWRQRQELDGQWSHAQERGCNSSNNRRSIKETEEEALRKCRSMIMSSKNGGEGEAAAANTSKTREREREEEKQGKRKMAEDREKPGLESVRERMPVTGARFLSLTHSLALPPPALAHMHAKSLLLQQDRSRDCG